MVIMECVDSSDIRIMLHRLPAGVWINISRILFVFLVKGECMTRQDFIGKTAGTINQNNANQIYAMLCNLVDTAAPADDTKYPLTEAQYKYVNESLVCIYNNDVVGVMRSIRNMIALGNGSYLSKSEYMKVRAVLMLLRVRLQNMDRTSHVLDNEMERD